MARSSSWMWLGLLTLCTTGCGTLECPSGSSAAEGRCLAGDAAAWADTRRAADAGASSDAQLARDAATACVPSCSGRTPVCNERTRSCGPCGRDSDCPGALCDTSSGACVACRSDAECAAPSPTCDLATGSCTGCETLGCSGAAPACSATTGLCTSCLAEGAACTSTEWLEEIFEHQCREVARRWGDGYEDLCLDPENHLRNSLRADAAAGRLRVEPEAARRCLAASATLPIEERYINMIEPVLDPACLEALRGALPEGAACADSFACESGLCRRSTSWWDWTACGTCVARGEEGAECWNSYDHYECADGLFCDANRHSIPPAPGACRRPGAPGASCRRYGPPEQCAGSGRCVGDVCVSGVSVGTPCIPGEGCDSGLYCDDRSRTCQLARAAGTSCTSHEQCDTYLCSAGRCTFPGYRDGPCVEGRCEEGAHCDAGTCRARPSVGEPCSAVDCAPGLFCSWTRSPRVCVPRVDAGDTCDESAQCPNGFSCPTGRCLPIVALGEACGDASACVPGTRCVAGRCEALPDIGEACVDACLRGACLAGVCASPPAGSECPSEVGNLDPCGPTGSCFYDYDGSRRYLCKASSDEGEPCSESDRSFADRECERGLTCRSGVCVASCSL